MAYAGNWQQANGSWIYQKDNGSFASDGWHWIDSNNDGNAECYYFDNNGRLLVDTQTPDGYTVDSEGHWVKNGVIQTRQQEAQLPSQSQVNSLSTEEWITKYKVELDEAVVKLAGSGVMKTKLDEGIEALQSLTKSAVPNGRVEYKTGDKSLIIIDLGRNKYDKYLYYGEAVEGIRSGEGTMYRLTINSSKGIPIKAAYKGHWENDAPNGWGEEYKKFIDPKKNNEETGFITVSGNYVNWYEEGEMKTTEWQASKNGRREFTYKAINGVPQTIGTVTNQGKPLEIVAYPSSGGSGYLTFYGTAQTACLYDTGDGRRKNSYGYWWK